MKKKLQRLAAGFLAACMLSGLLVAVPASAADTTADDYLVQLREDATLSLAQQQELTPIHPDTGVYLAPDQETIRELRQAGLVEYAEADKKAVLLEDTTDTLADRQWYLDGIGADTAWNAGLDGRGVRVGIIDSGLNPAHEDLENAHIETGYNLLNGSTDTADTVGHGTFVAGVLAAERNNGKGIAGLVDHVTIVPLKCFSGDMRTNVSYVISAIYKAVDQYDCDVINMSLGSNSSSRALTEAITYALSKNVLIVSAVGNDGTSAYLYPAADSRVVGVGAVNSNYVRSSFSQQNDSVTVVAPGEQVISLSSKNPGGYLYGSGTSFATPFVTAMAVMAKSWSNAITQEQFMSLLTNTATDLGTPGYDQQYGYGLINISKFVSDLQSSISHTRGYQDISGHWAESSIEYALDNGLMQGISDTSFAPDMTVTRAMLVTVLYRAYLKNGGIAITDTSSSFADVDPTSWYGDAVAWAAQNNIVQGIQADQFSPMENITREQLVTVLFRCAKALGAAGETDPTVLEPFTDRDTLSPYAQESMCWAIANGLVSGMTADTLAPRGTATRAQAATILQRYLSR